MITMPFWVFICAVGSAAGIAALLGMFLGMGRGKR